LPFAAARPLSTLVAVDRHLPAPTAPPEDESFSRHTVQFGETLPVIADQYLGNREAYWSIYEANLDVLDNPVQLVPGTVLKIPLRR
jgi:nucleoid-associated protein YgaU